MAKTTGPLLSLGAKGQIGKAIVFDDWKGIKYARQYAVPSNPNSSEQQLTRGVFRTLNEMWLVAPALLRAPWTANAVSQKYTDRNKFLSSNIPALRGEADMQNFIASPSALGGPPLASLVAATGTTPGGINWTATPDTTPTGWTLAGVTALAFPDQDPVDPFEGPIVAAEDVASAYTGNLAGFAEGILVVVAAFPRWTRPDGRTAYGASLVTSGTTDVT